MILTWPKGNCIHGRDGLFQYNVKRFDASKAEINFSFIFLSAALNENVQSLDCAFQCQGKKFECLWVLIRLGFCLEGDCSTLVPVICDSNCGNSASKTPFNSNQGHWSPSDLMWGTLFYKKNVIQYLAINLAILSVLIALLMVTERLSRNACNVMDIIWNNKLFSLARLFKGIE